MGSEAVHVEARALPVPESLSTQGGFSGTPPLPHWPGELWKRAPEPTLRCEVNRFSALGPLQEGPFLDCLFLLFRMSFSS